MENEVTQLTVAQLIEQLQKMPAEAPVHVEGCDCTGKAAFAFLEDGEVMIARTDAYYVRYPDKFPRPAVSASGDDRGSSSG